MSESNLCWLLCDLQLRKKTLVRQGKRQEVTMGDKWVFCPLQVFPRDRVSTKACEKCKNFKGYRKVAVTQQMTESITKDFKPTKTSGKKVKTITITDNDLENLDKKKNEWLLWEEKIKKK